MELINSLIFDYTLRSVAVGSAILGIVSGALGAFAVLRRQALLGDAISHTALPGIVLAFILTGSRQSLVLIIGAAVAGWLGTLAVMAIVQRSRIKRDSALGMVLAVFFGIGLVLLNYVQRLPGAGKAGLDKFLFGQASTLMTGDIITMGTIAFFVLCILTVFWKELKLLSFDQDFAGSLGLATGALNVLLTTLLVIAIVTGLQTVGVVLMSAMIVAPAAAARQWTDRLGIMVLLSALFGAVAGVTGAVLSSLTSHLPTGPTIVVCISMIVLISLLFAPRRGLVYRWMESYRQRRRLILDAVLVDLLELAGQHDDPGHPHSERVLKSMSAQPESIRATLLELERRVLVARSEGALWYLTESGRARALDRLRQLGGWH